MARLGTQAFFPLGEYPMPEWPLQVVSKDEALADEHGILIKDISGKDNTIKSVYVREADGTLREATVPELDSLL